MKLKIKPEYEALFPKLTATEYEALKKSIQTEGQHYPIAYNEDFEILDGHTRYKICEELGIEPVLEPEPRRFADKLSEKQFVLETNLNRRQIQEWNRFILFKPLMLILREKAEQRRLANLKQVVENTEHRVQESWRSEELAKPEVTITQNIQVDAAPKKEEGGTIEQFAEAIKVKPETVRQALYIEEHATPEQKENLTEGTAKIATVYKELKPPKPKPKHFTLAEIEALFTTAFPQNHEQLWKLFLEAVG